MTFPNVLRSLVAIASSRSRMSAGSRTLVATVPSSTLVRLRHDNTLIKGGLCVQWLLMITTVPLSSLYDRVHFV